MPESLRKYAPAAFVIGGYLGLYGPAGRDVLDPGLRALEASLRG